MCRASRRVARRPIKAIVRTCESVPLTFPPLWPDILAAVAINADGGRYVLRLEIGSAEAKLSGPSSCARQLAACGATNRKLRWARTLNAAVTKMLCAT